MRALDLREHRFGRLTVVSREGANAAGKVQWHCVCDCGRVTLSSTSNLRSGISASCGCIGRAKAADRARQRSTKHGHSARGRLSPTYISWAAMWGSCTHPSVNSFKDYGGRGITVCERWENFENFLADMGSRPSPKHSIDRINNDGNYEPGNCRWATLKEQAANKRPRLSTDK